MNVSIIITPEQDENSDTPRTVYAWYVMAGRKTLAGGYCATPADARSDAMLWLRDQPSLSLMPTMPAPLTPAQLAILSARIAAKGLDPLDSEQIACLTSADPIHAEDRAHLLGEDLPNRCGVQTDGI